MPRRIYDITFMILAVALVALVGMVNCLQGTPFVGALKCNFTYASGDLIVKATATVILLLFIGLLLGPVAAAIVHPTRTKGRTPTNS